MHLTKHPVLVYSARVTVCIAAICDLGETIVSASDTMLSLPDIAGDSAVVKGIHLIGTWAAMYSSDDVACVDPILRRVVHALEAQQQPLYVDTVKDVFRRICLDELQRERELRILSPLGLTMERFVTEGRQLFGEDRFTQLQQRIEEMTLACEFLVHGFDGHNDAHVFHVEETGRVSRELSRIGFGAIGSGAPYAMGSLLSHSYTPDQPSPLAIYRVCAAKFAAESAHGVGRNTVLAMLQANRLVRFWTGDDIAPVRRLVEEAQVIPPHIIPAMTTFIASTQPGVLP